MTNLNVPTYTPRRGRAGRLRIDRWNGNTLRRYHLANAILVVTRCGTMPRQIAVIPAFCAHISAPCGAAEAAAQLRKARAEARKKHA